MAAHKKSLAIALLIMVVGPFLVGSGFSQTVVAQATPQRIVSLIPSVTEMLFAIGAGARVVGVGNFDRYPPEVLTRTKVGGLIDPDVELILSLKPDLVMVYGSQTDLRTQLERARIPMFLYQHSELADVTDTIRAIGKRIGREPSSEALADRIETEIASTRRRVAGRPRPRTLLVFGRDAETLRGIYASGGIGFLHDMLEVAGGINVFADVKRQSVQGTSELVLARAPDVILEIGSETASAGSRNTDAWKVLGSVPAVRTGRIYQIRGDEMMNPGPRVAQAVRRMAEALHPDQPKVKSRK